MVLRVPAAASPQGPARLAVLVSGSGTNLAALLDACRDPAYGAEVALVLSDRPGAFGLQRAVDSGVATVVVELPRRATPAQRESWDRQLADRLLDSSPDLVVSAGFMRILGRAVLQEFPSRILNTHPALLPSFPGAHAVGEALAYGVRVTGATVHLVDAGVDTGPVVEQVAVGVRPGDDEATLHERIKSEERRMLVDVVGRMARNGFEVEGRKVRLR